MLSTEAEQCQSSHESIDHQPPSEYMRRGAGFLSGPGLAPLVFLFNLHAVSSISLTLINKYVAMALPLPFLILALQNLSSVLLTFLTGAIGIVPLKEIKLDHLLQMLPLSALYVVLIWSSLVGLAEVSVATVVIGRSLIPLFTALIEGIWLGTVFSFQALCALGLIFVGSMVYASQEKQPNAVGLGYVMLNVILSVITPILEKRFVQRLKTEQTPSGLVLYRNLNSLPLLLFFILYIHGFGSFEKLNTLSSKSTFVLSLSCCFSFTIGLAVFYLQTRVTATTIVTANNWYKLLTLLSSLVIWSVPFKPLGWFGIAINFMGLFWYSYVQAIATEPKALIPTVVISTPSRT